MILAGQLTQKKMGYIGFIALVCHKLTLVLFIRPRAVNVTSIGLDLLNISY